MFDEIYKCPLGSLNPETCRCTSCQFERQLTASRAALDRAEQANFARGSSISSVGGRYEMDRPKESMKDKVARQRRERIEQSDKDWNKIQQTQAQEFMLGWMSNPKTQPKSSLWLDLFTSETSEEQRRLIKQCNVHLNDPVREGEIVILPSAQPETSQTKQLLADLQEDAKAASIELAKLTDDLVALANRHFELLDHYANEAWNHFKSDGLPSDQYAYASLGVGVAASTVEQHLKNINGVLLDINNLYAEQVAMASRTGGINYGTFVAQRAKLFEKLDGSFARLSKRSIQLPVYQQIRRNLKLSTKSVVHNAESILEKGFIPNLGKRMANVANGVSVAKGVGYVGLTLGVASGVNSTYEACTVNSDGNCAKTGSREVAGFLGGLYGGGVLADLAVGGTLLVLGAVSAVGITVSAPVIGVASVTAFVAGGAIGGSVGSTVGKASADFLYEYVDSILE